MFLMMLSMAGCGTENLQRIEDSIARVESQYVAPPGSELTPNQQSIKDLLGGAKEGVAAEKERRAAGASSVEATVRTIGGFLPPPFGTLVTVGLGLSTLIGGLFSKKRASDLSSMARASVAAARAGGGTIDTTSEAGKAILNTMSAAASRAIRKAEGKQT